MKSKLVILLVFVAVIGGVGLVGHIRAQQESQTQEPSVVPPAPVRCVSLERRPYQVKESFYGIIEANAMVDMAFQIAGRVMQLGPSSKQPLTENQKVLKGDVIALLEPTRYEAAVEQTDAAVDEARAAMDAAQAGLAQAQVRLEDAQRELERFRSLALRNAANSREVEKAEVDLKIAQAQLDSSKAQLAAALAEYKSARAAHIMANVNLQDSVLKAPMDATVAAIPAEVGQMAPAGQTVVTLVDTTRVNLVLGVVESRLPLLRQGQQVMVEVRALHAQSKLLSDSTALAGPRSGTVTVVPPAADSQTGLFNVEVELDNKDGSLRPGMVGKATIVVMEKQAVAIPAGAATRSGDRAWAFFVDKGLRTGLDLGALGSVAVDVPTTVAKRVWFDPIAFDKDYYLVEEPPQGLELLIVEGQTRLRDGQTVRPMSTFVTVSTQPDS